MYDRAEHNGVKGIFKPGKLLKTPDQFPIPGGKTFPDYWLGMASGINSAAHLLSTVIYASTYINYIR
jgi:hypothetical protein